MKKIMIIDGGPRRTMNIAQMIDAFTKGVRSVDDTIEVNHVRLYDMAYHGCVSCMACKVKNSKHTKVCARRDALTQVLEECVAADGIVFASPIYFSTVTAQLQGFIERLVFPWLSYNDFTINPPRRIPTATIYAMNASMAQHDTIEPAIGHFEWLIAASLGQPERIEAVNTLQVKNYDRYDLQGFDLKDKQQWHEEHWQEELQRAYDAGVNMVHKIMER